MMTDAGGRTVSAPDEIAELLRAAAAGDELAWNSIVARFTNLLWSVGRAHRMDTAAISDVIQTTWLRLLENLDKIREPERLAGWLATTARRECLQILGRSGRELLDWDDDAFSAIPDAAASPVDHGILLAERDTALWQCFRRLSERCQSLLGVLMAVDRASYADVSAALGLPIGSIGPTRMRCVQRLRDLVADTGYSFGALSGGEFS